jgi:hypothetical protein
LSRQAGQHSRQASGRRQAVCRQTVWQEGRKDGRKTARQTDICTERRIYICQIYIQTYKSKDIQTNTDKQAVQKCRKAGRQTDIYKERRMFKHTYLRYIQTDRQTDIETQKTD